MEARFGGPVFEFKLDGTGGRGSAIGYVRSRDRAVEYRLPGRLVHRAVVELNRESRDISAFERAPVP